MAEDAKILQDTFHSGYYGATYASWKQEVEQTVAAYQQDMAGLNGVAIAGHEILKKDVRVTVYENGTKVFTNYSNTDFAVDGLTIPARSYLVAGGDAQ